MTTLLIVGLVAVVLAAVGSAFFYGRRSGKDAAHADQQAQVVSEAETSAAVRRTISGAGAADRRERLREWAGD